MSAPTVDRDRLRFTVEDPQRQYAGVSLDCDDALDVPRRFRRSRTGWSLSVARPDLVRVEYRLVITERNGSTGVVCDPANPERVRTAFGERSVALMPEYQRPSWLLESAGIGDCKALVHEDATLGSLPIDVWSPAGLGSHERARLLVVHDGPEYADLASLTHYAAAMISAGALPAFRMALMHPVERDAWYAANPAYVAATSGVLRTVTESFATEPLPVVMGASLGGLISLLAALAQPTRFGGVFSQSGSFFQARLDGQESSYPYFNQVTEAVAATVAGAHTTSPLAISLTCGALEENHANNQSMASALTSLGHAVELRDVADLHNYTAWRDSLHPTLTEVLQSTWRAR